jgi:hypothetical protein
VGEGQGLGEGASRSATRREGMQQWSVGRGWGGGGGGGGAGGGGGGGAPPPRRRASRCLAHVDAGCLLLAAGVVCRCAR